MTEQTKSLADRIRDSQITRDPAETALSTDERVLARITDGIYRRPSSALRELISNAYDADATEVVILTDAPRFATISVRDDGLGLSPEVLQHLVENIGGSPKRSEEGKQLGVTAPQDENRSPGGRQLIGKLGIGLFSVAQFTRHFLIITKTSGDEYRTIADITLGPVAGQGKLPDSDSQGHRNIQTGHARIWREHAGDLASHGTEIRLLELLPRTRAELASEDLWAKVEYESGDTLANKSQPPRFHIGRMMPEDSGILRVSPSLPWDVSNEPSVRFHKLVDAVRESIYSESESVDLESLFDRYLQTVWTLSLSAPLKYIEDHPFDLDSSEGLRFFQLENTPRGQAKPLTLKDHQRLRQHLTMTTPDGTDGAPFDVFIDGLQLYRPILFHNLPRTGNAVETPLMFVGSHTQRFENRPIELSGGPLAFEAYLFWAPKIIPNQHQGVILRVGNASGELFDRTFMGYQIQEQQRTRQTTAEVFVREGLDGAINLDRESFNYAHPHYQYLVRWLHSALRQLANKQKEIGAAIRTDRRAKEGETLRTEIDNKVAAALKSRGVDDVPEVILVDDTAQPESIQHRYEGHIVLRTNAIVPPSSAKIVTAVEREKRRNAEKKAGAIAQLLHGWGLLETLSFDDQERLIRDIVDIMMMENL